MRPFEILFVFSALTYLTQSVYCNESSEPTLFGTREDASKFKRESETRERLDPDLDPCLLDKKIGRCKAAFPRFFFNKDEGKCQSFIYGGCSGNKNNFKDFAECERTCAKHLLSAASTVSSVEATTTLAGSSCAEQPVNQARESDCGNSSSGSVLGWRYNGTEGKCGPSTFTGCPSTFETKDSCEATCLHKPMDICNLPREKGPCFGEHLRYFFSKRHNRCVTFEYGGCHGNANNFETPADCLKTCGGGIPSGDKRCSETECPWHFYEHYSVSGCKPIFDGEACCPTRFDCPDKRQDQLNNTIVTGGEDDEGDEHSRNKNLQCRYQGKFYNIGEDVREASNSGSCRTDCVCTEIGLGKAKIICSSVECPENLDPAKRHCIPLYYKKESCCAYDFYCRNDTLIIHGPRTLLEDQKPPLPPPRFKCNVDGESFYEGQQFYPKKNSCLRCICAKGFSGSLTEEFCTNIDCGIEIYHSDYLDRGCVPVYMKSEEGGSTGCCPQSWECPGESDHQIPVANTETSGIGSDPIPSSIKPLSRMSQTNSTPSTSVVTGESSSLVLIPPRNGKSNSLLVNQSACDLPKEDVGTCKGSRPRFTYNKDSNTCEHFLYSGCGGNDNNFVSLYDCQRLCLTSPLPPGKEEDIFGRTFSSGRHVQLRQNFIIASQVDLCTLPKRVGNCKGYFHRYFYSPQDNSCRPFIFGGCRGNANNFYSRESCEAVCKNQISVVHVHGEEGQIPSSGDSSMVNFGDDSKNDVCNLPRKKGHCKAYVIRYFYDRGEKTCKPFVYGGCQANANNFQTSEECEKRCGFLQGTFFSERLATRQQLAILPQPGENGNDSANVLGILSSSSHQDQNYMETCRLPMKAGPCLQIIPSYYYDVEKNTCSFFLYSGCFGNANRFNTLTECESQCKERPTLQKSEEIVGRVGTSGNVNHNESGEYDDDPSFEEEDLSPSLRNAKSLNQTTGVENEVCNLPKIQGTCGNGTIRFYWEPNRKKCLPFIYSGCEGNGNNFIREAECASVCRQQLTIEQLTSHGVLSCTFGSETILVGATLRKFKQVESWNDDGESEVPCGVSICQCITPPSVTCFQTSCHDGGGTTPGIRSAKTSSKKPETDISQMPS